MESKTTKTSKKYVPSRHRSVKVVFRRLPIECTREEFEEAYAERFGTSAETIRFEKGKKK